MRLLIYLTAAILFTAGQWFIIGEAYRIVEVMK